MNFNPYNEFEISEITFIPFKHHRNNLLWLVSTTDGDRIEALSVVAETAEEAATRAHSSYQKMLIEELRYEKWREEMKDSKEEEEQLEEAAV